MLIRRLYHQGPLVGRDGPYLVALPLAQGCHASIKRGLRSQTLHLLGLAGGHTLQHVCRLAELVIRLKQIRQLEPNDGLFRSRFRGQAQQIKTPSLIVHFRHAQVGCLLIKPGLLLRPLGPLRDAYLHLDQFIPTRHGLQQTGYFAVRFQPTCVQLGGP